MGPVNTTRRPQGPTYVSLDSSPASDIAPSDPESESKGPVSFSPRHYSLNLGLIQSLRNESQRLNRNQTRIIQQCRQIVSLEKEVEFLKAEIERLRVIFPHQADEFMARAVAIETRLTTARAKNRLYMEFTHSTLERFNTLIEG